MNKKKIDLKSISVKLIACMLALTMVFPTFAAGGADGDTSGSSTPVGGGGTATWGTEPRTGDLSGMKVTLILSPKDPTQTSPDKLYRYRAGYYAEKTPIGMPPGSTTVTDVNGGYPIYFLANEGCLMEGTPIFGDTYGKVTRQSISNYVVRSAGAFTSDAETAAMLNKVKGAMSINWWGAQGSLLTNLGLLPVTDDLTEDVKESRKESNSKIFKAMGAVWYKLYPNEITKSIMETGYYENETEEVVILMEPMITLQPFASCGTEKYGITMSNFLNTYLYTRSTKQDITKMADIAEAFTYAKSSPLYTRFSSQPVPYEGHNNIIGTLISKRGDYSGLSTNGGNSIASKLFFTGPIAENTYADWEKYKHGFGLLRNLDWISGTSSTVFYGLGNLEGQSGGSCLYIKKGSTADGLSQLLMNADKFKLQGSAQEIIAQMVGLGRKAYGGAGCNIITYEYCG